MNKNINVQNAVTLANATELAAQVVGKLAGNGIGNTVQGKPVSSSALRHAVATKLHAKFLPYTSGE